MKVLDKGSIDLVYTWGNDDAIIRSARASFSAFNEPVDQDRREGMIRFMMENKHGSVFEHCGATFHVKAPLVVFREWHRHRTQSFNETSGRYSEIEPEYYVPARDDIRHQVGKPGYYSFERMEDDNAASQVQMSIEQASKRAFAVYKDLLGAGVAKEQARLVLPVNMYSQMVASANLRNWLKFLDLRTSPHAMKEIRLYAEVVQQELEQHFPVTMAQYRETGVAP